MPTTKQDPTKHGTTTVRLPWELVEQVRQVAVKHERSLSAEMRVALRDYIRREGGE